jgi:hypothetical protein
MWTTGFSDFRRLQFDNRHFGRLGRRKQLMGGHELKRSVSGGHIPPDYQYFWNRPFGRGTCAFLSALALAGLGLPIIQKPAVSQNEAVMGAKGKNGNATWGFRVRGYGSDGFNNATWGNRTKGSRDESFMSDGHSKPHGKLDQFLAKRLEKKHDELVDVIVSLDGPTTNARESVISSLGGKLKSRLHGINALALNIPAKFLTNSQ